MPARATITTLAALTLTASACTPTPGTTPPVPPMPANPASAHPEQLAASNAEFAFDLLHTLHSTASSNVFFSPHSLSTALAMVWAGARGNTSDEIARVMHWSQGQDATHDSFAALTNQLAPPTTENGATDYDWTSANRLWPGLPVLDPFRQRLATSYASDIAPLDFSNRESAASQINSWADTWTRGHITKIVEPNDLKGVKLVLTNAVYFKGAWTDPFKTELTSPEPFHGATSDITVPMMHDTREVMYTQAHGLSAIRLPYRGGVSCIIILPDDARSLDQAVSSLTGPSFTELTGGMKRAQVVMSIPKLKARTRFSANDALQSLGMATAFSDSADFTGISPTGLAISDVLHAATVDLDEEGTVATAITSISVGVTSAPMPKQQIIFRVDHPYMLAIIHDASKEILFLGRINDPTGGQ